VHLPFAAGELGSSESSVERRASVSVVNSENGRIMKNFALIGAAGYIAPRHMNAIRETGNRLVAALDPNDSVGVLDKYFPNTHFFTEFERFDRYIDKLRRKGTKVDYVAVTSPNYLHDAHIRFAHRIGAHAICEKPLVVNPWNIDGLKVIQEETGLGIFNILQLRLHPSIIALRNRIAEESARNPNHVYEVDLTYLTSRGPWYFASWKGEETKSGGIAANIGVHFYDMLIWVFGPVVSSTVNLLQKDVGSGSIVFERARVRWFLSVNGDYLPEQAVRAGQRTYRSIMVDGAELEFSDGFTDLHTESYKHILSGKGFGLIDALPSIQLVHAIRTGEQVGRKGNVHPLLERVP
jgi:UDP-N-acetyl-2-amino-2-deoxyglucuronate dehydrogenase